MLILLITTYNVNNTTSKLSSTTNHNSLEKYFDYFHSETNEYIMWIASTQQEYTKGRHNNYRKYISVRHHTPF